MLHRLTREGLCKRLSQSTRWFAPRQHVWLHCQRPPTQTSSSLWRVEWGMTTHGMDQLGDITHLGCLAHNDKVQQDQDLLRVHWEGYEWTEADELYHTVWQCVEGEEIISSPVAGKLVRVVNSKEYQVDEDITWVEMECSENDLSRAAANWVDEASYYRWIKTLAPGKFSDNVA